MVPVAIYKYGRIRPGAFLRFRQRALARDLGARLKRLIGQTESGGFGPRPDVIAHSLGTLLLGLALRNDPTMQVGRIILLGSILRPDFNWKELIKRGQVEAVLNNYGTEDFWALVAHYFIPDSGPSGRTGFNDRQDVINVAAEGFGHSDFFSSRFMTTQFEKLWRPFLTRRRDQLSSLLREKGSSIQWRQAWWPLRANVTRLFLFSVAAALALLFLSSLVLGFMRTVRWVGSFI